MKITLLNNGINKINVSSDHAYRHLTKILKDNKISWHSYENKRDRDIRVMLNNIHHSFQPTSILRNLCEQGLKALNAKPKLKWKTKEPLDTFIVSFHGDRHKKRYIISKQYAEQLSQSSQLQVIN
jgi:hypothetical protein